MRGVAIRVVVCGSGTTQDSKALSAVMHRHCNTPAHVSLPAVLACRVFRLCRFTYCVTRHRPQLTGFDQGALTAAVLQALPLQNLAAAGLAESVEAMTGRMYDLVMLLRHVCQLNFKPPAGRQANVALNACGACVGMHVLAWKELAS